MPRTRTATHDLRAVIFIPFLQRGDLVDALDAAGGALPVAVIRLPAADPREGPREIDRGNLHRVLQRERVHARREVSLRDLDAALPVRGRVNENLPSEIRPDKQKEN